MKFVKYGLYGILFVLYIIQDSLCLTNCYVIACKITFFTDLITRKEIEPRIGKKAICHKTPPVLLKAQLS